ncbi:MAG: hypothetical protein M1527_02015 [Gammaproteobacteria bacterium]|nr:hypothetical protein [Gammaproteobacteria bacterium]
MSKSIYFGVGVGLVAVVAVVYLTRRAGAAVADAAAVVGDKINPYSSNNFLYDGVIGGAGRALSGDSSWSLGSWIYDLTHPERTP